MLDGLFGNISDLLSMPFFQMALIGGALTALICSTMGIFIVLRKEAMIGDSVAHTAFGGIALGLLLGIDPMLTALLISILAILGISYMKKKGIAQSDTAMAVMLAMGFSLGLIVISIAGGFNVAVMDYMFGSILTITANDLAIMVVLGTAILVVIALLYKELLSITFDEQAARMNGIPVGAISFVFNMLVALTIVLSIKVVGIVLVVALIVIPSLTALQFHRSFRATLMASTAFGMFTVVIGIIMAALFNAATSGVIVFTAAAIFLFVAAYQRLA